MGDARTGECGGRGLGSELVEEWTRIPVGP